MIGLYPGLLPSELRNLISQNHPTKPPVLLGEDLAEAMKHLITFLTQVQCLLASSCAVFDGSFSSLSGSTILHLYIGVPA